MHATGANVIRLRSCSFVILTVVVFAACDPGFAVWFRNDSDATVIVQILGPSGESGTGFVLEPESVGGSFVGLGSTTWSSRVRVVDAESCEPLWEQDVKSSPSGVVWVDASGTVSLVTDGPESEPTESQIPLPAATQTKDCLPEGIEYSPMT
jgi:hypothetical protein